MPNILQCLAYITLPLVLAAYVMYVDEKKRVMMNDVAMILDKEEVDVDVDD